MKTQFKNRKGRRIIVNGIEWVYKVGRQAIVAHSESGKRRFTWAHELKPEFERGQWKRTSDGAITPRDIEAWLK